MNRIASPLQPLSLVLPLILSLLPLLILSADVSRAKDRQQQEAQRAWVADMRLMDERLGEVTTPAFWIEAMNRRIRLMVEQAISREAVTPETPHQALQRSLRRAVPDCLARLTGSPHGTPPPGMGEPLVWAMPLGKAARSGPGQLFSGPGFQDRYRAAFLELLRELGAGENAPVAQTRAEARAARMRTLLGAGVSTQMLLPAAAGKPFTIIYQQQQGLAVWDVIRNSGS
jgi:hypothetical protein